MVRLHGGFALALVGLSAVLAGCQSVPQQVSPPQAVQATDQAAVLFPPEALCAAWSRAGEVTIVARSDEAGTLQSLLAGDQDLLAMAARDRRDPVGLLSELLRRTAGRAQQAGHRGLVVHYDLDAGSARRLLDGHLPMTVQPTTDQPMVCSIEVAW
ncbi:MAG: hypothetical protein BIFFINMI_00168 [Phycisphaerae bacterium]|nr:hypothetical protein [Phycisphaerae bacterium]